MDLRAALTGRGNFSLVPGMSQHSVPLQVWATATEERKEQLFTRFLRDNGSRSHAAVVTSKDGVITMPATPRVARKPSQKTRARATRTRSVQ